MKEIAKLEFDMQDPDARDSFNRKIKADAAFAALWDIANHIFRPHRKHGYNDAKINEILEKTLHIEIGGEKINPALEIISLLESKFYEILEVNNINLSEDYS